jgi:hypothetical protein
MKRGVPVRSNVKYKNLEKKRKNNSKKGTEGTQKGEINRRNRARKGERGKEREGEGKGGKSRAFTLFLCLFWVQKEEIK